MTAGRDGDAKRERRRRRLAAEQESSLPPMPLSRKSIELRWKVAGEDDGAGFCVGMRCVYCLADLPPERLTIDHVFPVSRGGCGRRINMALACRPCNSQKGDRTPQEWQPWRWFEVERLNWVCEYLEGLIVRDQMRREAEARSLIPISA